MLHPPTPEQDSKGDQEQNDYVLVDPESKEPNQEDESHTSEEDNMKRKSPEGEEPSSKHPRESNSNSQKSSSGKDIGLPKRTGDGGIDEDNQGNPSAHAREGHELRHQIESSDPIPGVPKPGPIQFTVVSADSISLIWGHPEGFTGDKKFRVTCSNGQSHETTSNSLVCSALSPGQSYEFTVATLDENNKQSEHVSATAYTEIPLPADLDVKMNYSKAIEASWSKPKGLDEPTYVVSLDYDSKCLHTAKTTELKYCFPGVVLNMKYIIRVAVALKNGQQGKVVTKKIITGIPTPVNLEVGSVTATSASLSWSMPSEMDEIPHSFLVSYHSKGAEPKTITTESFSVVITGLTPDTEHAVSIFITLQDGAQSQPAVTSISTGIPPPRRVQFSVQCDAVTVSWEPPEGLAGPHRYKVTWKGAGAMKSCKVSTNRFRAQSLAPGEKYVFTVATVCDEDRVSPCVESTIQTEIPFPKHVVIESDITSLSVKWMKPDGLDEVSYQLTLNRNEECETIFTDSLEHCFRGLLPGTKYGVGVATALNDGLSEYVLNTSCTSIPAPEKLVVDSLTPTSASISWSVSSVMDQSPHRFLISYHSEGVESKDITTDACSKVITDLKPGIQYKVSVSIVCEDAGKSEPASTSIRIGIPIPVNLEVGSVTATSASLSWSMPSEMNEIPHSFLVSYHSKGAEPQTITTESCSVVITGLTPDTEHAVSILTTLQDGQKGQPAVISVETGIPIPVNLEVGSVTATSASLSWSMPTEMDEIPHSFLVSYHSKGEDPQTITTESCSAVINGLTPGTEHPVSIFTILQDGRKGQPAVKSIITVVPSPESVGVESVTTTSAMIKWRSTDGLLDLEPYFLLSIQSEHFRVSCDYHHVQNLKPGSDYTGKICTVLNGRKSQPVPVEIHTLVPQPEDPKVDSRTATSAKIKWTSPHELMSMKYFQKIPHSFIVKVDGTVLSDTESSNMEISNLQPGTLYNASICTNLNGRYSDPVPIKFHTAVPSPERPTVVSVTTTTAMIKWFQPHELDGIQHSYKVQTKGCQEMSTMACNIDIPNLEPDTTYIVQVWTVLKDQRSEAVAVKLKTDIQRITFATQVIGNTQNNHLELERYLVSQGFTTAESHHDADFLLAFCVIVSRVGTDMEAALKEISDTKHTLLVVMHHTFDPDYVIPDTSRFAKGRNITVVDVLFHEDKGILKSQKNQEAKHKMLDMARYVPPRKGSTQHGKSMTRPTAHGHSTSYHSTGAEGGAQAVSRSSMKQSSTKTRSSSAEVSTRSINSSASGTGKVTYFTVVSGNTLRIHEQIQASIKERTSLMEVFNEEQCNFMLVFCPIVSSVKLDIERACKKIPDSKSAILVVMHHTFDPDHVPQEGSGYPKRDSLLVVHCLFHEDQGFLKCQRNKEAIDQVIKWLSENFPRCVIHTGQCASTAGSFQSFKSLFGL